MWVSFVNVFSICYEIIKLHILAFIYAQAHETRLLYRKFHLQLVSEIVQQYGSAYSPYDCNIRAHRKK